MYKTAVIEIMVSTNTSLIRAVTYDDKDLCVRNDNGMLRGMCVDIWDKLSRDLGIGSRLIVVDRYPEMYQCLQNGSADVIVQFTDDYIMSHFNVTR